MKIMDHNKLLDYIKDILENMPTGWLNTTTHRLDIYDEKLAKTQFLEQFENLYNDNNTNSNALDELPTAYDYIRLGHPLSCILEWGVANLINLNSKNVISFSSKTIPILAILRKNLLDNKSTQIIYSGALPDCFDAEVIRSVYDYKFICLPQAEIKQVDIDSFEGSTIFISSQENINAFDLTIGADFFINTYPYLGSILVVNGEENESYISEIQHVRRRETICMTPANSLTALQSLVEQSPIVTAQTSRATDKASTLESIKSITEAPTKALVSSSGLSIQYAIMMGLVNDALENHKGKAIKFIVPPNCYGGTNDQARRVAACVENVEVVDLPVDGDNDLVQSLDTVLAKIVSENDVPYIIAEIPTNPRVEVPDLEALKKVLSITRKTSSGEKAIAPVFILDQTFCPNLHFLSDDATLSSVKAIAYASGSKFPSGGLCTAGYCIANKKGDVFTSKIALHLELCDNEATNLQYEILARQLPSMNQRIKDAYKNTREFVNFIEEVLPQAKINFVSQVLANQGFTPSVFSLDLPTKGNTAQEKETYKRALNHKLIKAMITQIPDQSKYCVSYGQLKGCYWTIPATSTQGTTKEGDKDYIARVSVSPQMDLELHKKVFLDFAQSI